MDFNKLLKSSLSEVGDFTKRNATKFAIVADLKKARDSCKTKEARVLIETLIAPLQKELSKECSAFDARMGKIWKQAKGEEVPPEMQKKLDGVLQKATKDIAGKSGEKVKHNSDPSHTRWIEVSSL